MGILMMKTGRTRPLRGTIISLLNLDYRWLVGPSLFTVIYLE